MESFNTPWRLCVLARCALISIFALSLLIASTDADMSMYRHLVEVDHAGNPSWLSAGDRTLVSQIKNGIVQPNAIVAMDGSGQYKTITDGINSYPNNHQGRYIIYVKAGIYKEYVTVDQSKTNILLYGDGPNRTIITGNKSFTEGIQMPLTATFSKLTINLSFNLLLSLKLIEKREIKKQFLSHQSSLFVSKK
jgi:pectinesterase